MNIQVHFVFVYRIEDTTIWPPQTCLKCKHGQETRSTDKKCPRCREFFGVDQGGYEIWIGKLFGCIYKFENATICTGPHSRLKKLTIVQIELVLICWMYNHDNSTEFTLKKNTLDLFYFTHTLPDQIDNGICETIDQTFSSLMFNYCMVKSRI